MPSFFGKKSRSQAASEGQEAARYRPPPPPQQHSQLHPHDSAVLANQTDISPTVPTNNSPFPASQAIRDSTDHLAAVDRRAAARLSFADDAAPPGGRDHRHPAHRVPAQQQPQPPPPSQQRRHSPQPSLDRPTINLVVPNPASPDWNNETASFNSSLEADKSSETSPHPASQDLAEQPPSKLKRKNRFGLHSSPSSPHQEKGPKGLGRSFSVRHKAAPSLSQDEVQQQLVDRRRPLNLLVEQAISQAPIQQRIDPGTRRPSEPLDPGSPRGPHPTQRLYADPLNTNTTTAFHQRAGSGDSFASQVSLQQHHMPLYQEGLQPPSALHPSLSHHPAHQMSPAPDASPWPQPLLPPASSYVPARRSSQQSLGPASPLMPPPEPFPSDYALRSHASSRRPSANPHPVLTAQQSDMAASERPAGARPTAADSAAQQTPVRRDSLAAPGGPGPGQSPYPQSGSAQASNFKGNVSQQNLQDQQPGRETPPSAQQTKFRDDVEGMDVAALIQKHDELQMKYTKVKRYYFEKEAQVQQLQNTVAHQRMAVSRTVLDDNEYTARFNRLDGAIKDLAFSIRKEWKSVPSWLHPYVNEDAVSVGTKEMTAIGRAVISRWIVDEIFDRHFHPGLEVNLSVRLKSLEANLQRQQVPVFTEEDKDNQTARLSTWRRTTLDGLSDILQTPAAQDNQTQLTDNLVEKLSATMEMDLKDPPPIELGRGVRMIVENAMGILEKVPLEARDICAEYFSPGAPISETSMRLETGLPPLTRTIVGGSPSSQQDPRLSADRESAEDMDADKKAGADADTAGPQLPLNRDGRKKYNFGSLISKKPTAQADPPRPGSAAGQANNGNSKDRDGTDKPTQQPRVRLAAFMAVEVRGKGPNAVLIKAPVYALDS